MYGKIFASLYKGTMRGQSNAILVFTYMLATCDIAGIVDTHFSAIASDTGLTDDQVRKACEWLEKPDPDSRSPDEGGRRIVRVDDHRTWGWRIVNYAKYRAMRNEDDRREQNRQAQARRRAKLAKDEGKKSAHGLTLADGGDSQHVSAQSAQAEADADAEADTNPLPPSGVSPPLVSAEPAMADRSADAPPAAPAPPPAAPPAEPATPVAKTAGDAPELVLEVVRPDGVSEQTWHDFLKHRKTKKAPVTETVIERARIEADKLSIGLGQFLQIWCMRGSQGLFAAWVKPEELAAVVPRDAPAARQPMLSMRERQALERRKRWEQLNGRPWPEGEDGAAPRLGAPS